MHVTREPRFVYMTPPPDNGRIFTARETTRATVMIEITDCTVIAIFAHRDSGMTSVGLNAAAFVKARYR